MTCYLNASLADTAFGVVSKAGLPLQMVHLCLQVAGCWLVCRQTEQ